MPRASRLVRPEPLVPGPESGGSRRGRLDALTGLRFYAALLVVLFHFSLNRFFAGDAALVEPLQFLLKNGGWFGVTFFFVLSGFVLTWSAMPGDTPGRFLWKRLAKIGPNHIVMFVVALAVAGLGAAAVWEAGANLFLLHAWVPRDTAFFSINHPSWSISAELFFYAMFPFALPLVKRIQQRNLIPVMAGIALVIMLLPFVASLLPAGELFGPDHAQSPLFGASILQVWSVYAFPPVRFLEFFVGMLAARAVAENAFPRIPVGGAIAFVLVAYAGSLFVPVLWQVNAVFVVPAAFLIIAAAQAPSAPRALGSPRAVHLGELSFALYMVHDVVLTVARQWLGQQTLSPFVATAAVIAVLAVSLAGARILWKYIETPSNTALRHLSSSNRKSRV